MRTEVVIIGAGGHSRVVVDALLRSGAARETIQVVDADPAKEGRSILGLPVLTESGQEWRGRRFHVAVGDCRARQAIHDRLVEAGATPVAVIHPAAVVSPFATLAAGCFVAAQAVVGPAAAVESGVIVNHGAVVDHDCALGAFCHIAPNVTLGGAVRIGARALIGAAAAVLPGVVIGDDSVIGAGSVVLRDVAPGETYVGVPAKRKRRS